MKRIILILLSLVFMIGVCYSQAPIKRKKKEKTEQTQPSESQRQREAATKRKQEEEARRRQEEETRRQQEEEARRKQEEETRRKQEEEARRRQEEEALRKQTTGSINGHEWVDLGLSVKWATMNVGANSPSDYGNYYAWGETIPKTTYTEENSLTYGKTMSELRSSGIINTAGNLTMSYDAARANWGGTWRMPTKAEINELVSKCQWLWISQGGHWGYRVTGPNGKSIFVPAAGWRYGTSLYYTADNGYYWSSSCYDSSDFSYSLYFNSGRRNVDWDYRYNGRSVRPVSE